MKNGDKKGHSNGGRKPYVVTPENDALVRKLAALGVTYEDIASRLRISSDTLVKYFKETLEDARIDANTAIAGTLFNNAKNGNMTAAIFWLKTRAGWKETQVNEHGGIDGKPILLGWAEE